ncbi:hypothetical protein AMAG_07004 [Allomyces macrogynus ATCC 38327]|uniref:HotDog ACOT-type domain-containing protein n=1 Tax=Allomyces macrogynus (strain ATCC 38327) TaxID=578462 RepID=A0A0L0SFI6_ALLM3|nr:hypothetical protein AMAG_07004 [Allomyces macrogynus ATCC 38327]|eukprot:KNE61261.1 hypothetical protein AMAG_07004 [Allomyces macrogynus ATCC 38327]
MSTLLAAARAASVAAARHPAMRRRVADPTISLALRALSDDAAPAPDAKDPYKIGKPFAAADQAPADATNVSATSAARKQYSVLPHRTSLTSRLWLDRYDKNNEEYKKVLEATGGNTAATAASAPRHLVLKRMKDSYISEVLPFRSNPHVKEEYCNYWGGLRIAKLLEDLDALAGSISYTHCDDGTPETPPLTIVTASVDRIDLLRPASLDRDMQVSGMVTYVGSSSMEITVNVEALDPDSQATADPILKAKFTMVARDPLTNKAVQVNPLVLDTDEERRLYSMGAELRSRKKLAATTSLFKQPPTPEERLVIHDLWLQSRQYSATNPPANIKWLGETTLQSAHLMQPQDRNIHGNVFGGILMKQAFELAFLAASVYSRGHPRFLAMDDITFRKPVPIGSILHFTAKVVYSRARSFQVQVTADVVDPATGQRDTTNTFMLTFGAGAKDGEVPTVMPRTYEESMLYLDGKRRWETGYEMARENQSALLEQW